MAELVTSVQEQWLKALLTLPKAALTLMTRRRHRHTPRLRAEPYVGCESSFIRGAEPPKPSDLHICDVDHALADTFGRSKC